MSNNRIPIPWRAQWRRLRISMLPLVGFAATVVTVAALWSRQGQMPNALGRVEAMRVNVAAGADGLLLPLRELDNGKWAMLDMVEEGQILARLDDAPLKALLEVLRGELAMCEKELDATRATTEMEHYDRLHEYMREAAELACAVEKARLDILDRQAVIETDRIELKKANVIVELKKPGGRKGIFPAWEIEEAQATRDLLAKRIAANTVALRSAEETLAQTLSRQQRQPQPPELDMTNILAPVRASIAAAEAKVREVQVQIDKLEIRAPISGKICAIYYQPGQSVRSQDWVMTIGADKANHIIGFVRPEQRIRPAPGDTVQIRPHLPAASSFDSVVEQIGSQWEPLPLELARDQKVAEIVLPVRIKMPDGLPLKPGELVDIRFATIRQPAVE